MCKTRNPISLAIFALLMACTGQIPSKVASLNISASSPPAIESQVPVYGGQIRGVLENDGLKRYHAIPYAAAPVGRLRWAATAPVEPWQGVLDATQPGPACMQAQGIGGSFYGLRYDMSEDCLTLNVWTRATHVDENLPVMVWVHGGSLRSGSGSDFSGEILTSKGVILVTINYRLGPLGFLAHPDLSKEHPLGVSGNQGLRDQIAALEWVRDNISAFGGDTNNVTIFGESAGSKCLSLLQASPLSNGLFHKVIGQSGAAFAPMWYRTEATNYSTSAEALGELFGQALAGEGGDQSLAALRELPAETVIGAVGSNPAFSNYQSMTIVDGQVIPDEVDSIFAQGRQSDVPVMLGSNSDEGTTFLEFFTPVFGQGKKGLRAYAKAILPEVDGQLTALYPDSTDEQAEASWEQLFSDITFTYPMRTWARSMEKMNSDAFLYYFTWHPPIENREKYRAFHAAEIAYIFGDLEAYGAVPTKADHEFADKISDLWVQFAKTGSPNGTGLADWPAYSRNTESYMELGPQIAQGRMLRMEQMALIERAWSIRRIQKETPHSVPGSQ